MALRARLGDGAARGVRICGVTFSKNSRTLYCEIGKFQGLKGARIRATYYHGKSYTS
jgi:hypothetical protein